MDLFVRAMILLLVTVGVMVMLADHPTPRAVAALAFLGTAALVFGPVAAEAGITIGGVTHHEGMSGCVWILLGVVLWTVTTILWIRPPA